MNPPDNAPAVEAPPSASPLPRPSVAGETGSPASPPPFASRGGCPVRLPVFEGPLDLLLHLIRENELDIRDLPVARVAEQYLEYLSRMRERDLEIAAEYLVMAATLAWLKSRTLLPSEEEAEGEEEDPRAALVVRLAEYRRFRDAAAELEALPRLGRDRFCPPGLLVPPPPEAEREIAADIVQLALAFRAVLARARGTGAIHAVELESVSVREQMVAIVDTLRERGNAEFGELLHAAAGAGTPTRALLVAAFLALLELVRIAAVRIYQSVGDDGSPTGPIRVRSLGGGEAAPAPAPDGAPA